MRARTRPDRLYPFALLLALAIMSVSLVLPLASDQATYQSMAIELVRFGGLPYLRSLDMNFPGIVYLHSVSILLFGNSEIAFRTLSLLLHIGSVALLYRFGTIASSRIAGMAAGIGYAMWFAALNDWDSGQRDGFALLFALLAIWLVWKQREFRALPSRTIYLTAGVAMGFAMLIRPTFVFFFIILLWVGGRRSVGRLIVGASLPAVIALVPYLFFEHGLQTLYEVLIQYNREVYATYQNWDGIAFMWYTGINILFLFAPLLLVPLMLAKRGGRHVGIIFAMSVAAFLSVFAMGKFFLYHFEPQFALGILSLAVSLDALMRQFSTRLRLVGFVVLLLILGDQLLPRDRVRIFAAQTSRGGIAHAIEYLQERQTFRSDYGFHAEAELAHYLRQAEHARGTIEVATLHSGIRWKSERTEATRYTTLYPLLLPRADGIYPALVRRWQHEYIEQLKAVRPRYIILQTLDEPYSFFFDRSVPALMREVAGFHELLERDYVVDTTIRAYTIYQRKASAVLQEANH